MTALTELFDEHHLTPADGPATDDDVAALEASFDATLPADYTAYLRTVGGGRVGDLAVLGTGEVREANYPLRLVRHDLVAFARNDDGDLYCFRVADHAALDEVVFWDHEANDTLAVARPTFLAFVAHMAVTGGE